MDITELTELDPERVDGVGSPANGMPFLVIKSAEEYEDFIKGKYSAADLRRLKAKGHTYPGTTSYPIDDDEDLSNAIHAVGRGKVASHDKIRAYIIRRAKEMGKSSEIPENWNSDGSLTKAATDFVAKCATCGGTGHVATDIVPEMVCPDCNGSGLSSDMGAGDGKTPPGTKAVPADGKGTGAGSMGDADLKAAERAQKSEPPTDVVVDKLIEQLKEIVGKLDEAQRADVKAASAMDEKYKAAAKDTPAGFPSNGYGDTAPDKTLPTSEAESQTEEMAKSGKRISAATEKEIRQTIQALERLLGGPDASDEKGKDILKMTQDELYKMLDERDEARRQLKAEKAARKSAKAKAAKKAAKAKARKEDRKSDKDHDMSDDDMEKSVQVDAGQIAKQVSEVVQSKIDEELAKALSPLVQRLAVVESQPVNGNVMLNTAGLTAVSRGEEPNYPEASLIKSKMDELAKETDPSRIAKLNQEISRARLAAAIKLGQAGQL